MLADFSGLNLSLILLFGLTVWMEYIMRMDEPASLVIDSSKDELAGWCDIRRNVEGRGYNWSNFRKEVCAMLKQSSSLHHSDTESNYSPSTLKELVAQATPSE